jgi:predicted DNA-binding transcriptional regulator AlpA
MNLLTTAEAAALIGVKKRTVDDWRTTGAGPRYVKISHRCVRYRPKDIETWADKRVINNTAMKASNQ